jgi:hypothetical protein
MKKLSLTLVLSLAAASAACIGFERKSSLTGPSASGVGALMGTWTSSTLIPSPSSCTNFRWTAQEQTSTSARGSFSATCAGDLQVSGTAEGNLTTNSAAVIQWKATGTASAPGLNSCSISLNGTAELGVDAIRIPYSGTTCLGQVSGVETLRRN